MHDIESCKTILDIAERESRKHNGKRVVRLKLSVGTLSGTNPEHLGETLILYSMGTVAEGAELEFTKKPATIQCLSCSYTFHTDVPFIPHCKKCGATSIKIVAGDGVILESLEIETG